MKKLLHISGSIAIALAVLLIVGGVWGIFFTYQRIARENIVTPVDSARPEKPVRGPLTLKAQADIIRVHVLKSSGGKTYAEMPQQVPAVDDTGNPVLDEQGEAVMTVNTERNTWVTATTLTTALNLGILTYAVCGLIIVFGLFALGVGMVFLMLSRKVDFT